MKMTSINVDNDNQDNVDETDYISDHCENLQDADNLVEHSRRSSAIGSRRGSFSSDVSPGSHQSHKYNRN